MKLHLMKAIIYSVTLILLSIGLSACDKESDLIELENSETFFLYESKHQVHLSTVIEFLKEKNDSIPFTEEFKNLYGRAMWDENITVENSVGFVILVPVLSNDKANLNGIWMFNRYENLMNYGVIVNDEEVRLNKNMDYSFAFFEQELLEFNDKYKFEDVKNENSLTKDGYIIEHCNIIFAGNDNSGWEYRGFHCWETYEPGTNTNKYFYNGYTDQVGGGTAGGIDGTNDGGGSPDPDPLPEIIPDPSFTGTKAECVKEKLEQGGTYSILNQLLSGFKLDQSTITLKFLVSSTDYYGKSFSDNAKCQFITKIGANTKIGEMFIYIHPDRLAVSPLELARTILHESFHAYMYAKLYEGEIHNGLAGEPDFLNDWNAYATKFGVGEDSQAQHNYMANEYRKFMSKGLKDFFQAEPNSSGIINYVSDMPSWSGLDYMIDCLTWGGLKGTDAWKKIESNPTEFKRYNDQLKEIIALLPKDCK